MSKKQTTEKSYYGFKEGDIVRLLSTIECENKIIDINTRFTIISFPPKTTKANKLIIAGNYNQKEWSRNQFVYGKTPDGRTIRTYICNIKHAPLK